MPRLLLGVTIFVLAVVVVVIGGSLYFSDNSEDTTVETEILEEQDSETLSETEVTENEPETTPGTVSVETKKEEPIETVSIKGSDLPEGQRKLLETLGIDVDTFVVTPQMIACAEEKVGKERLDEIVDGATPSFLEGVSLFNCYK